MCSIRQRPIHRQQEGFADGFDTRGAPGPGLVGGELDVFAVGGEGGDLRGDVHERGGRFAPAPADKVAVPRTRMSLLPDCGCMVRSSQ